MAHILASAQARRQTIHLGGRFSKTLMAGPIAPSDVTISTRCMNRVLQYEPRDLTISVEAGIPYLELTRILAEHNQMIPLDPPFAASSTIGGVLAANLSGSRRRLFGTARDMVIGMTFATLEGKLIQTGGMVVKNVAGLDMAKVMIGSFGTLAAIATVNFKVYPIPHSTRTFVLRFGNVRDAMRACGDVLKSALQPTALDLRKVGKSYDLLVQAGGSVAMLDRFSREYREAEALEGAAETACWAEVREAIPTFLAAHPNGVVVRVSCKLTEVGQVLERMPPLSFARAGSGVVYGCFESAELAVGQGLIDFAPEHIRAKADLWPFPGDDFAMMSKIKNMFDPDSLLNRGRLYGRL